MSKNKNITRVINQLPGIMELIPVGNINVDLSQIEGDEHVKYFKVILAVEGLEDMASQICSRQERRDLRTWSMVQRHQKVVSYPDYLLATYWIILSNAAVRDPIHNYDHSVVLVCLCRSPLQENKRYLGSQC